MGKWGEGMKALTKYWALGLLLLIGVACAGAPVMADDSGSRSATTEKRLRQQELLNIKMEKLIAKARDQHERNEAWHQARSRQASAGARTDRSGTKLQLATQIVPLR
jgi:hypothetical protein